MPGAVWDATPIAHQWLTLSEVKQTLAQWLPVNRSKDLVGKPPPKGAIVLFDGSDTDAWHGAQTNSDGHLKAGARSNRTFGDFRLYLEFLVPLKPEPPISHPHRGNSGVFALSAYEIQIADTFALDLNQQSWRNVPMLKPANTWCGSIYGTAAPSINMCLPPLSWQSLEIEFKAARFQNEEKISPAMVSVLHNGVKVHDQLVLPAGTGGGPNGPRDEVARGPVTLQNHGNPNLFRNIWIVPK